MKQEAPRTLAEIISAMKKLGGVFGEFAQEIEVSQKPKRTYSQIFKTPVKKPEPLDLQLFYDQLIAGQIVKESDGEPWPLTKSEARQIVDTLAERLETTWPLRLTLRNG